jgi:hypothetical protein
MSKKKKSPFKIEGGYFTIDRKFYGSRQFSRLSCIQKLVLLHLPYYWIPNQPDGIAMSSRRLALELRINKDTAAKALRILEQQGFIRVVDESSWFYGKSRSYRLTFKEFNRRPATNDWETQQIDVPDLSGDLSDRAVRSGSKKSALMSKRTAD